MFIYNHFLNTSIYSNNTEECKTNDKQSYASYDDAVEMNVIAHRGYSSEAPENTIEAFELAVEKGYNTVECDIEWTKDGVPIILHDSTINRTGRKINGKKFILPHDCSKYTFDELSNFDFGVWKNNKYKGTNIPSFEQLLDCSKDNDLNLYVELKEDKKFDKEKAKLLVDQVKEAGLEDKVTWISFNEDYLKMIREELPEARLGFLSEDKVDKKTIQTLEGLKTSQNEVFLDVKSSKINQKSANMLKESGFDFEAWTVNNIENIDELYNLGCSGITTDTLTNEKIDKHLEDYT